MVIAVAEFVAGRPRGTRECHGGPAPGQINSDFERKMVAESRISDLHATWIRSWLDVLGCLRAGVGVFVLIVHGYHYGVARVV